MTRAEASAGLGARARILDLLDEDGPTSRSALLLALRGISAVEEALDLLLASGEVVEIEEQTWSGDLRLVLDSAERARFERGVA